MKESRNEGFGHHVRHPLAHQTDRRSSYGGGSPFGPFALVQSIGYPALLAKPEELYAKFKLEIFKPTKTMREGNIKV